MVTDLLLSAVLLICLYTDIKYKKIYNVVTLPAVLVAIIANLYLHGLNGGIDSVKGLVFGLGLLFIPFVMGGLGQEM